MPHILINNLTSKIENLPWDLEAVLKKNLSYEVPGAFFSPAMRNHGWDGRKYLYKKGMFPTGLLRRVFDFCDGYNLPTTFEDLREKPKQGPPIPFSGELDHYSQQVPLEKAILAERGILRLPTGTGKTRLLCAIAARLNVPTLITTHRLDILEQIVEQAQDLLGVPIGVVQGKVREVRNITVGMLPSLVSCLDEGAHKRDATEVAQFVETAGLWICDEAHHSASDTYFMLANRCFNAYWRYGLTATPYRTDNKTLLIEACLASKIVDITASDLIERKRLSRPYIWFIEWNAGQQKKQASVVKQNIALSGTERYRKIKEEAIVRHPERNRIIVDIAVRRVKKGRTVLIAVTTIEHSRILYDLLKARLSEDVLRIAEGSVPKEIRKQYLQQLNEKKIMCVIATSVFGEGVNVPELSCLINATGRESSVDTFQLVGRALRRTKTKSKTIVIDFWDKIRYFQKSAQHRWDALSEEPKFILKRISSESLHV